MASPTRQPSIPGGSALIVGGTSGVGLATAKLLTARGLDRIVLVGRDPTRGKLSVADIGGPDTHFVQADAGEASQAQQAVNAACELIGVPDFVVTATVPSKITLELLHRLPLESIREMLLGFALPPLHITRAVLPALRERGSGVIVNVASDAAKVPTPGEAVIGAAMAAIVMCTRAAALEAKRDGIRINAVTPSLISDTPTSARVTAEGFSARLFAKAADAASLGVATAADVAEAVVFLCDERSARTTGQVISVNGGISVA